MSIEELIAEALKLPRDERARLAEELYASFDEPADLVERAWAEELERRCEDLESGRAKTVPWETVREEILREIEKRRASRISS